MNVTQLPPFVSSPSLTMSVPAASCAATTSRDRRAQRRIAGLAFPGLERARQRADVRREDLRVVLRSHLERYVSCGYALRMAASEMTS